MKKNHRLDESQEIHISFSKQNKQKKTLNQQESNLRVEVLRVNAIEKQRQMNKIWNLSQQQLCQYLMSYKLFPQNYLNIEQLVNSSKLKLVKSDGKIYFGEVDRRKRHGWGIYVEKGGYVYQGRFQLNQKRGKGIQIYSNGNLYVGEFQNNKKHGRGVFYWFNLSIKTVKQKKQYECYQGEWWGGLPDGQGVHIRNNGDCFIGIFKNGLKHGQGEERYGNGDYYLGEFINGMPEGYGEYQWSDGSSYKGDFKQGLRSGYGCWKAHKNRLESYQGHYSSDKKEGYGIYVWDNGWTYHGNFQNDYRNGYGELFDSNRNLHYKGQWQNGNQLQRKASSYRAFQLHNPEPNSSANQESDFDNQLNGNDRNHLARKSANFTTTPVRKYESAKLISSHQYNKSQMRQYATLSAFGQQSLSKRPEMSKLTRTSSIGKNIRVRQQIGTRISRPLAPGPEAIMFRNSKSAIKN